MGLSVFDRLQVFETVIFSLSLSFLFLFFSFSFPSQKKRTTTHKRTLEKKAKTIGRRLLRALTRISLLRNENRKEGEDRDQPRFRLFQSTPSLVFFPLNSVCSSTARTESCTAGRPRAAGSSSGRPSR